MTTKKIFGLTYYRNIYDNDLSKWVKSVVPTTEYDWVFRNGNGGFIVCALGRDAPRYRYLKLLFSHSDDPQAAVRLVELLKGPKIPSAEMRTALREEFEESSDPINAP